MKLKNIILYWLPPFLYAGLIFYLSSQSQPIHPGLIPKISYIDKVFHIVEYFILSFLIVRLLKFYKIKKAYIYAIILTVLYGVTDEVHQLFIPGRLFSLLDIIANLIGATLILFLRKFRNQA